MLSGRVASPLGWGRRYNNWNRAQSAQINVDKELPNQRVHPESDQLRCVLPNCAVEMFPRLHVRCLCSQLAFDCLSGHRTSARSKHWVPPTLMLMRSPNVWDSMSFFTARTSLPEWNLRMHYFPTRVLYRLTKDGVNIARGAYKIGVILAK